MVRHFLFSPMKQHRHGCVHDYKMRIRIATSLLILFFGGLAVYLAERYLFAIPLPFALALVIALMWYIADTFFDLAALDHQDRCRP